MKKEMIICIVIVVAISLGNYITQKYASNAIYTINNKLEEVKEELKKSNVNKEVVDENLATLDKQWNEVYPKMAYFIEHNELEKVETSFTEMRSFYENDEYVDAISQLDKSIFLLAHIKEKNELSLENIF